MGTLKSEASSNIAQSVQKYLGVPDEDLAITNYVINLYSRVEKPEVARDEVLHQFKQILAANGGGEFPQEFVTECFKQLYDPIKQEKNLQVRIKKENVPIKQEDEGRFIKKEDEDKEDRFIEKDSYSVKKEPENLIKPEKDYDSPIKSERPERSERSERQSDRQSERDERKIEVGGIYRGYVTSITSYGAFINLNDRRSFQSGLCHISQLSFDGGRVNQTSDIVKTNQQVFVKVTNIEKPIGNQKRAREKISLSMRGIDQMTGEDKSEELKEEKKGRGRTEVPTHGGENRGTKRRLTSPERWEIRQLIASGAVSAKDYPELEDPNLAFEDDSRKRSEEVEIDIEIELNPDKPKFLQGQVSDGGELEPVKVFKNPEGSLVRSAMNGSKFSREHKEARIKEKKEKEKASRTEAEKSGKSYDPLKQSNAKDENSVQEVISKWKSSQKSQKIVKRTDLSIKEQRQSLPVYAMRTELVETIRKNQFVVVVGETGSGKTTQIVQYLMEEGFNRGNKVIGCTQPRRVAAVSVAKRVSEEVGVPLGQEVGYLIRFEDNTSPSTKIKYMTDGMLEREALNDPYMKKYSVIMLDEAHERTIATDVLFALLKKAAAANPDLKVIVTSATLDAAKFSSFFNNCPVMTIPGRTFPVEILYTKEPEMDYLQAALDSVVQIHISEPEGDILVFLTGQDEIDTGCEVLEERMKVLGDTVPELIVLPVYAALPPEMQTRIFEPTPPGSRKVILATNIAETSITIDGIYYVVDPGFMKLNAYDAKIGMDSLVVSPISQAQAKQRSGRAGRTGPGKCYRLYTENAFQNEMLPNTIPEIQRQNLSHTILMLKAMGIHDIFGFDFMDPPPANTMLSALQNLYTLSALDESGELTPLGRQMANFPMEPALAKTLITSVQFGCSEEMISIVAMLSVQTVFYRPKDKQTVADQKKARFHHHHGDHLTYLNVYRAWDASEHPKQWCHDNYVQERSMRRAHEVRRQLESIMRKSGHQLVSCGSHVDRVRKALVAGYFKHSAKRDPQEGYKTVVEHTPVSLHPSSALFGKNPEYVMYHTLLLTTKEYMHCVTAIEPKWLVELAPAYFKVADPAARKGKIVPLKGKTDWRLSAQHEVKRRALENLSEK